MSITLFGSRSLNAKIGGCYYHILTRVITFLVLISSSVITISIFSQIIKLSWVFPGFSLVLSDIFVFSFLPFGLSSAPYVFTKCLRPFVKFWRFSGVKIVVFLDDGCGKGDSLQIAKRHSLFVQSSLSNAGFVANSTKSLWDPSQSLVWLGLGTLFLVQFLLATDIFPILFLL